MKFKPIKTPNIHVFGAGGTGAYTIQYLLKLLNDTKFKLTIYDGDSVEDKNLKRQNFTHEDLDINKAVALVTRYKEEYTDVEFEAVDTYVTDALEDIYDQVMMNYDEENDTVIFISAVDNVATRKLINEAIQLLAEDEIDVIALDSGNSDLGGQVVLYTNYELEDGIQLPNMLDVFPELKLINDENPGLVMDCTEMSESNPQAMMCNVRNADTIVTALSQLFANNQMNYNVWKSDILSGNTHALVHVLIDGEFKHSLPMVLPKGGV